MRLKCKIKDFAKSFHGDRVLSFDILGGLNEQELEELIGRDLSIDIKQWRERRSLDANAYFWTLIDKLAAKTKIPKSEIYINAILEIGGNSDTVCVSNKAVNRLITGWRHNGLGWVTQTAASKIDGCTNVVLYQGSSEYDTAQMSRLIENIVQECEAQGIETKTPKELALLLEGWGK